MNDGSNSTDRRLGPWFLAESLYLGGAGTTLLRFCCRIVGRLLFGFTEHTIRAMILLWCWKELLPLAVIIGASGCCVGRHGTRVHFGKIPICPGNVIISRWSSFVATQHSPNCTNMLASRKSKMHLLCPTVVPLRTNRYENRSQENAIQPSHQRGRARLPPVAFSYLMRPHNSVLVGFDEDIQQPLEEEQGVSHSRRRSTRGDARFYRHAPVGIPRVFHETSGLLRHTVVEAQVRGVLTGLLPKRRSTVLDRFLHVDRSFVEAGKTSERTFCRSRNDFARIFLSRFFLSSPPRSRLGGRTLPQTPPRPGVGTLRFHPAVEQFDGKASSAKPAHSGRAVLVGVTVAEMSGRQTFSRLCALITISFFC